MAASLKRTLKHDVIRTWVERRHGEPARARGTTDALKIKFGDDEPTHERIPWEDWFKIFDEKELAFVFEDPGYSAKIVARNGAENAG